MKVLFLEYPKCTTCKKAKKWLEEHKVDFEDRDIKEKNIYGIKAAGSSFRGAGRKHAGRD